MRIYLASQWARRAEMRIRRQSIQALGHTCTSRWLDEAEGVPPAEAAQVDMADILAADSMILFTETPQAGYMTGGRHVECGFAIASGIPICVVGPRENIFHHLPQIYQADDLVGALARLGERL